MREYVKHLREVNEQKWSNVGSYGLSGGVKILFLQCSVKFWYMQVMDMTVGLCLLFIGKFTIFFCGGRQDGVYNVNFGEEYQKKIIK